MTALCCVVFASQAVAATPEIVTWASNTPEWNERLGVTLMRQGCDAAPAACLQRTRSAAKVLKIDRWAVAAKRSVDQWPADALEYSQLSLTDPLLVSVDVDDFLGALKSWHAGTLARGNDVLAEVTRNIKLRNPRLQFGITLYEDELDSQLLAWIPVTTRERIDRVSLYLHYRANADRYAQYVAQTRRLFPKADIWAGIYAYDRIDYLPCTQQGKVPCSSKEDLELFETSLRIQLELLRTGQVAGVEFYPGHFGREDQWHGWNIDRICRPQRRAECIENTRRMREVVASEFARMPKSATTGPGKDEPQ